MPDHYDDDIMITKDDVDVDDEDEVFPSLFKILHLVRRRKVDQRPRDKI